MKTIKRIIAVLCIAFMASTMFVSCVRSCVELDKKLTELDEKENNAIRDCLKEQDFQKAHDLLKRYTNGDYDYDKIQQEVYQEEIKYLIDQNDDAAWLKAFSLVQEYKSKHYDGNFSRENDYQYRLELIKMLADYAVMFNHSETTERICKLLGNYINEMNALSKGADDYDLKRWERVIATAEAIQMNCDCE